jgi:hypothetical protein
VDSHNNFIPVLLYRIFSARAAKLGEEEKNKDKGKVIYAI